MREPIPGRFFCPMPYLSVDISSSGETGYCCEAPAVLPQADRVSPSHFLQSKEMVEIRRLFESNATPLGCQGCAKSEAMLGQSKRLREIDRYLKGEYGPPLAPTPGPSLEPQVRFLSYRLGNRCNLKCLMCNPNSSHLIAQEDQFTFMSTGTSIVANRLDFSHEGSHLRSLYIGGGEPFLSKDFLTTIEYYLSRDPHNIDILLNTNLTHLPTEALNKLSSFRSVYFGISVDGFCESFEYIRYPHKWSLLVQNLQKLLSKWDFHVDFHFTLSALNLGALTELARFLMDYPQIGLRIQPLTEPNSQLFTNLTTQALSRYRQEIDDFCQKSKSQLNTKSYSSLLKIASLLRDCPSTHSLSTSESLINFLKAKDKLRRTSYSVALPRLMEDLF